MANQQSKKNYAKDLKSDDMDSGIRGGQRQKKQQLKGLETDLPWDEVPYAERMKYLQQEVLGRWKRRAQQAADRYDGGELTISTNNNDINNI